MPNPDHHIFTDDEAWLRWRRSGVGSSDISALMVEDDSIVSPWATPRSLYRMKLGLCELSETPRMTAGKRLEQAIFDWWSADMSFNPDFSSVMNGAPLRICLRRAGHRLSSTPDGWCRGSYPIVAPIPVEVKNVGSRGGWDFDRAGSLTGIPRHYWYQCQAHIACSGADRCVVVVLFNGWDLQWTIVERDEIACGRMERAANAFFDDHVSVLSEPPPWPDDRRQVVGSIEDAEDEGRIRRCWIPSVIRKNDEYSRQMDAIAIAKDRALVIAMEICEEVGSLPFGVGDHIWSKSPGGKKIVRSGR